MPSLAHSLAEARVTDAKPPFVRVARLAGRHATGWLTSEVVTATTWPDCCRRICATASCETEKHPTRFVPIAWLRSCAVSSLNGLGRKTPALFTSTSILPHACTAVASTCRAVAGWLISPSTSFNLGCLRQRHCRCQAPRVCRDTISMCHQPFDCLKPDAA